MRTGTGSSKGRIESGKRSERVKAHLSPPGRIPSGPNFARTRSTARAIVRSRSVSLAASVARSNRVSWAATGSEASDESATRSSGAGTGRAGSEIRVADADGDGSRGGAVAAQVGCGAHDQREQLAFELGVVVNVRWKRLIAADALCLEMWRDDRVIHATDPIVQPFGFARAEPAGERRQVVLKNIRNGAHAQLREPFLELRADERKLGKGESTQELSFRSGLHDMHTGGVIAGLRLGPLDRELRDQLRRSAAEGNRKPGPAPNVGADAHRGLGERLPMVQRLGSPEVEIPLVDAGSLDHGGVARQHLVDLVTLHRARLPWNRDAYRLRTQPERARDRHRRADAELAGLVGCGADDTAALAGPTAEQQRLPARALRVDHARDGDEKRVGVGQQNASWRSGRRHPGKVPRRRRPGYWVTMTRVCPGSSFFAADGLSFRIVSTVVSWRFAINQSESPFRTRYFCVERFGMRATVARAMRGAATEDFGAAFAATAAGRAPRLAR